MASRAVYISSDRYWKEILFMSRPKLAAFIIVLLLLAALGGWLVSGRSQFRGYATPELAADTFFQAVMLQKAEEAVRASDDPCRAPDHVRIDAFREGLASDPLQSYQVLAVRQREPDRSEAVVRLVLASGDQMEYPYQVLRKKGGWRLRFDRFEQDMSGNVTGTVRCDVSRPGWVSRLADRLRSLLL